MEKVVLVNDNNKFLGTALKAKVHTKNTPLHKGLSVFLFNSRGELLLQQRAKKKKTFPLIWSNSVCGHPRPEEKGIDAAKRHLLHELGINKARVWEILPNFKYTATAENGIIENEFCPVFAAFSNEQPQPNSNEIENIRWISWKKFVKETEKYPKKYSQWSVEETKLLNKDRKFNKIRERNTGKLVKVEIK